MKASPLTDKARPGGRPRKTPATTNPFSAWLSTCGFTPDEVASKLGVGLSTVYSAREGYFLPSRKLAIRIAALTAGAVSVDAWDRVEDSASRADVGAARSDKATKTGSAGEVDARTAKTGKATKTSKAGKAKAGKAGKATKAKARAHDGADGTPIADDSGDPVARVEGSK